MDPLEQWENRESIAAPPVALLGSRLVALDSAGDPAEKPPKAKHGDNGGDGDGDGDGNPYLARLKTCQNVAICDAMKCLCHPQRSDLVSKDIGLL